MNRIQKISLSIFSAALLAGAMFALPSHAASQASTSPSSGSQASPSAGAGAAGQDQQLQSVSGKITSVSGKTFTLQPSSSSPSSPAGAHFQASPQASAMTFTIDDNTTVSGKLAVGASADVTYRTQSGENVAVSVRVS